jgi:hypothetical protein
VSSMAVSKEGRPLFQGEGPECCVIFLALACSVCNARDGSFWVRQDIDRSGGCGHTSTGSEDVYL